MSDKQEQEKKLIKIVLTYDPETGECGRLCDPGWPVPVLCHLLNIEIRRHETMALSHMAMQEAQQQMQGVVGPDGLPAKGRPNIVRGR